MTSESVPGSQIMKKDAVNSGPSFRGRFGCHLFNTNDMKPQLL
jgi:hypothetical protein